MRNLYSIFLGTSMVTGLFFLVDAVFYNNNSLTTNLFIIILLLGGYVVTYTSSTSKTRTAILSGLLVGIGLMIYQLIFNRAAIELTVIAAYFILPGFFMMIGGFTAKLTNKQLKELLDHFLKGNLMVNQKVLVNN